MYPEKDIRTACEYLINNAPPLNKSKILVTGASGFVGSWLLHITNKLQREYGQKFMVTAVSRDLGKARARLGDEIFQHIEWITGDIQKVDLGSVEFSHVIHGATPTTAETGAHDTKNVYDACVGGLKNILNTCQSKATKARVLHLSSGVVYQGDIDEIGSSSLDLAVHRERKSNFLKYPGYLETKLEAEKMINDATHRQTISGVNVRLFAFYGPGLPIESHYAIGNFMRDGLHARNIEIQGTGRAVRSYLAGHKMGAGILYALLSESESPFHVGSTLGRPLSDWADDISKIFDKKVCVRNEFDDSGDSYVAGSDPKMPLFENYDPMSELLAWKNFLTN